MSNAAANRKKKDYSYLPPLITGILFTAVTIYYSFFYTINVNNKDVITVYRSPTCGCCNKWVEHLKDSGLKVQTINTADMSKIKKDKGVPTQLKSCHTAVINGYIVEGHVPANDIKKLLSEKRNVKGLSVPNMPMGSPGMEGSRRDRYNVYEFDKMGDYNVINQY